MRRASGAVGISLTLPTREEAEERIDALAHARPDPDEVRFYDTGDGFEVECASCHDPHGVPSDGAGSTFNPAFLRVANSESNLCLSCHVK